MAMVRGAAGPLRGDAQLGCAGARWDVNGSS